MIQKTLPNISVDCVIFGYDSNELKILLFKEIVKHDGEQYIALKLPGDHVRYDEVLEKTAERVLYEQTGVKNIYIQQLMSFSDPERLKGGSMKYEWLKYRIPDERVITVGFFSLVNISDITEPLSEQAYWSPVYQTGKLIFDHNHISDTALERLRNELLHNPIAFELLPAKFTLTELQKLYESIFNTEFDKRNFRRKISKMKYLIPLEEFQSGVSHKPARYYRFDRGIYEATRHENFDFRL